MINYDGYLKLIDFGFCKLNMKNNVYTHSICGTPEYYSPELLNGNGYSKSVDWWTIGCFTYEL